MRKVVGNTLWQLTDKILRMIVGLLVGIWVGRYLGPTDWGLLNFAIAFVALFSPIADLGVQAIVVRDLVKRPEHRMRIVSSALALRLMGALSAALLAASYIYVSRPDDVTSHLIVLAVALSLVPQAWDVIDYDYQARMHPRLIVVIRTISLLVFAMTRVELIKMAAGLVSFAMMIVGEAGLSALLMWIVFKRQLPQFRLSFASWDEIKYLLRSCWPLGLASLSVMLYMRIDQVMLGQMLGDRAVGIFSAAVRVSESWLFIPMAILTVVAPVLIAEHGNAEGQYLERLVLFTRFMVYLSVVVAGIISYWSHQIVELLYGNSYADAGSVLKIHAWAGVFASIGLASGPWFVNAGMLRIRMLHTLMGAAINIVLNLYLIPRFGVFGSAVSTLISYSVAAFWLNALAPRTWPIFRVQMRACFNLPKLLASSS